MSNNFDGIPNDLADKIRKDLLDDETGLKFYKAIMDIDYPEISKDARIAWIRNIIKDKSWYNFRNIHNVFNSHIKGLKDLKKLEKKREVLIDLEKIIGNSCYNGNIQNYSSWGVWESEGRSFRYPVTFYDDNQKSKWYSIPKDISIKAMMTGYYAFGANQLCIFKALMEIINYLEENYGLDLSKKKK